MVKMIPLLITIKVMSEDDECDNENDNGDDIDDNSRVDNGVMVVLLLMIISVVWMNMMEVVMMKILFVIDVDDNWLVS